MKTLAPIIPALAAESPITVPSATVLVSALTLSGYISADQTPGPFSAPFAAI